jgi:Ca2+-binding EF-hand superfamily protein
LYHDFIFLDFDQHENPFHPRLVETIRNSFDALDGNKDGFLEPIDLQRLYLTPSFATRLCDMLYVDSPRDFKWFVGFMSIWNNLDAPWASARIFDVFDIDENDLITEVEVRFFWKDMERAIQRIAPKSPPLSIDVVVTERFDAFGGAELAISREQFIAVQGQAGTFVKMLVDIAVFAKEELDLELTREKEENEGSG